MARIDDFIVPNLFTLTPIGGQAPLTTNVFGSPYRASIENPGPHRLEVPNQNVDDMMLFLYGGERLELELQEDRTIKLAQFPITPLSKSSVFEFGGTDTRVGILDAAEAGPFKEFAFGFQTTNQRHLHTNRPGFVMLDVSATNSVSDESFEYRLYDYEYRPGTSYPVVEFPPIEYDPAVVYDVTMRAVPMGRTPRRFVVEQAIDQIADRDLPFETNEDGVDITIYRTELDGNTNVVVELKSDDPSKVRELVAVCTTAGPVKRQYRPDWSRVLYTFTLSPDALAASGDEKVRLQIFKESELFNDENDAITHQFQFP